MGSTFNKLEDSLSAYFNFDNEDATDTSGNQNDGTAHGSPTYDTNGHEGKELLLNSSNKKTFAL